MEHKETLEENKSSGRVFGMVCILVSFLIGGYFFRGILLKKFVPVVLAPQSSTSTGKDFSPEVNDAIDRFIFTKIEALSTVAPATGTKFSVSSIERLGAGKRIVIYTDTTATYTAHGIFEVPEAKKINIVEFDLVSPQSSEQSWSEGQKIAAEYITKNIASLSPEKEVLGGKFYITKIIFENENSGVVEYEDGYNAYRAQVSFQVEGESVKIVKWNMLSTK